LKRFFNDALRQPHNGLDIAAPAGSGIVAPASGTVIGVGNFSSTDRIEELPWYTQTIIFPLTE